MDGNGCRKCLIKFVDKEAADMEKSIFEVITDYAVNEGLGSAVQKNDEYKRIHEEIDDLTSKFNALGLPKEQRLIVDRLLTSYNESGAHYGKMTYQQGFRDCASLLVEIGMIKDGKMEESA